MTEKCWLIVDLLLLILVTLFSLTLFLVSGFEVLCFLGLA